jgi:hypothetical protein
MWGLFLLVGVAGAMRDYTIISYAVDPLTGYIHIEIPRIGSGEGKKDKVQFIVDFSSPYIIIQNNFESETTRRINNYTYADTFYWKHFVTTQEYILGSQNVFGFSAQSDIWKQVSWLEVCPWHNKIILHQDAQLIENCICGYGSDKFPFSTECALTGQMPCFVKENHSYVAVDFLEPNMLNGSMEWFGVIRLESFSKPNSDVSGEYVCLHVCIYIQLVNRPYHTGTPRVSLDLYPEYVPRSLNDILSTFLLIVLPVFYLVWIVDHAKDTSKSKYTRISLVTGNIISLLSLTILFYNYNIDHRIYTSASAYKSFKSYSGYFKHMILYWQILLCSILHFLVYCTTDSTIFIKQINLHHKDLHIESLYDIILSIPITILLMSGGRKELMNIFILFIITTVVMAIRFKDLFNIYLTFKGNRKDTKYDIMLYILTSISMVIFSAVVITTVWEPTMAEIFLMGSLSRLVTLLFFFIFIVFIFSFMLQRVPLERKNGKV